MNLRALPRVVEEALESTITMKDELIRVRQIEIKFLLERTDTNGSLAIFEFTVPAGARGPLTHFHEGYDETVYGAEGVMTFTVDGKTVPIGKGESCFIRRGIVAGFNRLTQ